MNSTRTEADRFHGHYKAEECARLPDLKHHCEEYLIATTERSEIDEVLKEYHRLKEHYRKKLAKQKPKPKRKPQSAPGKKRYLRDYSGMDPKTKKRVQQEAAKESTRLGIQRRILNRARDEEDHFQGTFKAEECAMMSGLKYYGEEYLCDTTDVDDVEGVREEYRRLKQQYQTA